MSKRKMTASISQREAIDVFGLPEVYLYVCDGKKECGKQCCTDFANGSVCHHTADESHALYKTHLFSAFERHPAVRAGGAAVICVEPIRG